MNIFNNLAHNVGGFWGYMLWCLGEILREPFSGIMEFEVMLLKCVVVYARVALEAYGSILLTLLAIYVIVYFVLANRMPHFHMHVGRWIGIIVSVITEFFFAGLMLILGGAIGNNGNRGERYAQVNIQHRTHPVAGWSFGRTITHLSLHFQLGRLVFRGFYWLVGLIPIFRNAAILADPVRGPRMIQIHIAIARILALALILWGFWRIPADWVA